MKGIAAAVRLLGLVSNNVRERRLGDLPGEVGDVARPIAEARAETMHCGVFDLHPAQHHFHGHIGQRLIAGLPGKNELPRL